MISNFKIKNFRLFSEVEINKLSQVNLIVGKNSAGKSALLEAFLLYFSKMSVDVLLDLLSSRQEHWVSAQNKYSSQYISSPIRHLFKGHVVPELLEDGFKLSSESKEIHVKTAAYISEDSELGLSRRLLDGEELESYDHDFLDKYIILKEDSSSKALFPLDRDMRGLRRSMAHRNKKTPIPCQFVSTNGLSDMQASSLWDGISLTDLEKEVLIGINLIEPEATGITFVANNEYNDESRIPLVKIANIEEPVPLKSLGDGMTRIFQIILSLVCAKDGVLIIDEFENGLHWSVQKDVWDIVFKLALRLNVQVFCSTHSRDCIQSFESVWGSHKKSASFIRVVKEKGVSSIKEYEFELLSDSLETDVEVR